MHIGELEEDEPEPNEDEGEEVYEAKTNLIEDEYEGEEESLELFEELTELSKSIEFIVESKP